MNEQNKMEDVAELDLRKVWAVVKRYWIQFFIVIVMTIGLSVVITSYFMTKIYTAEAKVIIVNTNHILNDQGITYSDIQLSQNLVNTYSKIMKSEAVSDEVIANLNLWRDYRIDTKKYNDMVSVSGEDNTEVMMIRVSTAHPKLSADIANEIISVFQRKIIEIMQIENTTVLNSAKIPTLPSEPSLFKNVLVAVLIGVVLCGLFIVYKMLTDTRVKTESEIRDIFDYPIIAKIQDYTAKDKEASI